MKTTVRVLSLVMVMVLGSAFTMQASTVVGDTYTEAGKYWLKRASNHMVVNNRELKTFVIHFDNVPNPVYIGVLENNEAYTQFLVRTDNFEVMYTAAGGQLGIQYVPETVAALSREKAMETINRENFLRQRIISTNVRSEEEMLSLIACYLPEVMN